MQMEDVIYCPACKHRHKNNTDTCQVINGKRMKPSEVFCGFHGKDGKMKRIGKRDRPADREHPAWCPLYSDAVSCVDCGKKIYSDEGAICVTCKRKAYRLYLERRGRDNAYTSMKTRHGQEFNTFPLFYAFTDSSFEEGMKKLGLDPADTDKVFRLKGIGAIYRCSDHDWLIEMTERHAKERQAAIDGDINGDGYIFDMFVFELNNHEYCYDYDFQRTLDALDLSWDILNNDSKLLRGLYKAMSALRKADE
jgi:hypothetical protein